MSHSKYKHHRGKYRGRDKDGNFRGRKRPTRLKKQGKKAT